ncbi:hypothetical protein AKJ16_DCAP18431 [Drosera capensis]
MRNKVAALIKALPWSEYSVNSIRALKVAKLDGDDGVGCAAIGITSCVTAYMMRFFRSLRRNIKP